MDWSDNFHEFGFETTVIRHRTRFAGPSRLVLWPVYGWRVLAPVPRKSSLNLFQRAVLRLAQARVTSATLIAEHLLISSDLAARVVLELQQRNLVDPRGEISERGVAELADRSEEEEDLTFAHVFSDAITGKVWPYLIAGDLPIADVEQQQNSAPRLLSGSEGDPRKEPAFVIFPRNGAIRSKPSASDVIRAARRHRKQLQAEVDGDAFTPPRLGKVTVFEDAKPYLLALSVTRHESGDWQVKEPFGRGESYMLRSSLEAEFDSNTNLRDWIFRLFGGVKPTTTIGDLQKRAEWAVESELTLGIRSFEMLRERLVAMHRALLEAEQPHAPADKWDDILVKAQRVLERLLADQLRSAPAAAQGLASQLADEDKEFNRFLLNQIAAGLGFETPLPQRLTDVRRGKVLHAERDFGGSLRPLLILSLLSAETDLAHPMRSLAAIDPSLLHRMDGLAAARDNVAHESIGPRSGEVRRHIETTYIVVRTILDLVQGSRPNVEEE